MSFNWAANNPFAKADRGQIDQNQPQQSKQQQQQIPQDASNINNGSGVDPTKTALNKKGAGDDPMADFESLWEPNKNEKGEVIEDTPDTSSYLPPIDDKRFKEMVDKVDFTKGVTSEELAALKAGGEDAVGAMMNMMNRSGRQSFSMAFSASNKIAEQGIQRAQERFMKGIPNHVREMMVDNNLSAEIGISDNPLFKPLVSQAKAQFLKKFPKASPDQIRNGLKQYFDNLKGEFNKKPASQENSQDVSARKLKTGDPTANFEDWLGEELVGLTGGSMFKDTTGDDDSQT